VASLAAGSVSRATIRASASKRVRGAPAGSSSAVYVTVVPNRGSPPAILLRETYREEGKVKNRTLANLTKWKPEKVDALRAVLRDERLLPAGEGLEILRSLPHGHIAAALGVARRLGLDPRVKMTFLCYSLSYPSTNFRSFT
jgi:hypothetical protein